jgi:hydroxyacylglutathione hydrolase
MITKIKLSVTNDYLIRSEQGAVLVDTGYYSEAGKLIKILQSKGIAKLNLIILTHGHADHAGAAALIREKFSCPILIGKQDEAILENGANLHLTPTSPLACVYKPFLDRKFPAFKADILLETELDLRTYGIEGKVIPWPGHTPGSLIVVLNSGDVFVGDIIRAGYVGGLLKPHKPLIHYYSDDVKWDLENLGNIIQQFNPKTIYVGHGGPVSKQAALDFLAKRK